MMKKAKHPEEKTTPLVMQQGCVKNIDDLLALEQLCKVKYKGRENGLKSIFVKMTGFFFRL